MNMMIRLSIATALATGGLLLTSCDPYGPPPGFPRTNYDQTGPPRLQRGDGYDNPYGNDQSGYGDPYAGGSNDGGGGRNDPYGANDGGGYTDNNPPARNTPPPSSGNGSGTSPKKEYPTATRTANPSRVLSPYPPYNVIDVGDIKSGKLAKDPSTGEVFRVP